MVGGDTSRVWASARGQYVPSLDETYLAWRENIWLPTPIASEEDLRDALGDLWPVEG